MEFVKKHKDLTLYLFCFAVFFVLCMLFPYTHDDWAWGSIVGTERLGNWFEGHSGRYLGNLIELAITRSVVLKSFLMSSVTVACIFLVRAVTGNNKFAFGLTCSLIIFMPSTLFRQTIAWAAGFANYTMAVFIVLIYMLYCQKLCDEKPKSRVKDAIFLALLGFLSALVVEHFTFYSLVLAGSVIAYTLFKYRTICLQQVMYLVGAVSGTVLMLSNSAYSAVLDRSDSYRTVAHDSTGLYDIARNNLLNGIVPDGFLKNTVLLFVMLGAFIFLCVLFFKKSSTLGKIIMILSTLVVLFYTAMSVRLKIAPYTLTRYHVLLTLLLGAAMFVFPLALPLKAVSKIRVCFYVVSIGIINVPLLAVTPMNPRCFFGTYMFLICYVLELLNCLPDKQKETLNKYRGITAATTVCGLIFLFYIYSHIHAADVKRINKARADSLVSNRVEVSELPYSDYVWIGNVKEPLWNYRFKLFYGIDEHVELINVPYSEAEE